MPALRAFSDAAALAGFAARWYSDKRPASRRLLLEYLRGPLNAFRHEPLIKRLFKLAEAAGDDEVMSRFMALFDRSIRREEKRRLHVSWAKVKTQAEAQQIMAQWRTAGFDSVQSFQWQPGTIDIQGSWYEPLLATPIGTTMPRGEPKHRDPRTGERVSDITKKLAELFGTERSETPIPPRQRKRLLRLRLFSVATRQYLRRRVWRYFRRLGKDHPERYVAAVSRAIVLYTDEDVSSGLELIDNWGLIHALFHRSPVLKANPSGWLPVEGRSLAELAPAPIYERLWEQAPRAIVDVLVAAACRPVRQWAVQMVRRYASARASISFDDLLLLLPHEDPDVVALAAEILRDLKGLELLSVDRWLELVAQANPAALHAIVELMQRHLNPATLALDQVVKLAAARPLPVARLGLEWLKTRVPKDEADDLLLLSLTDAQCEPLRGQIVRLASERLLSTARFEPAWVLAFLDSRHPDVRDHGMSWFRSEPRARDDVGLWRQLAESPFDDVRIFLISELESRIAGRDVDRLASLGTGAEAMRLLWASVLLNVHRGSRAKPTVIRQIVRVLRSRRDDSAALVPLLAVALRSARGPDRRAGLAAVAELVERQVQTPCAARRGVSGAEAVVNRCDDSTRIDPVSGRAVSRDLLAAAFRRGRHWPSLCVPEAVVLSLPHVPRRGTEPTGGLPQRGTCGSSVNDLGPCLEVGPARPPAGSANPFLQTRVSS